MSVLAPATRRADSRTDVSPRDRSRIRQVVPDDRDDLVRFVECLSPTSAYRRFLTGMGGRPRPAVIDLLLTGGEGGGALVAVLDDELVAHALWVRTSGQDVAVAEIAIMVADARQHQGIGSLLLQALRAEMAHSGIERVQVVTSTENDPVLRMIARHSPTARAARDGATLTYELPLDA